MTRTSTIQPSSPSLLLLAVALLAVPTGCATVADMSASMLGPNAVEKVQHRRQAKEIDAVKDAQDSARAAQLCDEGVDKDGLALKTDLRVDICQAYGAMMAPVVEAMSCEEFVTTQPTLLRFNETAMLNDVSDARAKACKQQLAEARAAAEAQKAEEEAAAEAKKRAEVLAKLSSQGSREEYAKICGDSKYATSLGLDNSSRTFVCDEYVAMSVKEMEQASCDALQQKSAALYEEGDKIQVGGERLETLREAWLQRATSCEKWAIIFADIVPAHTYQNERNTAYVLLKNAHEYDAKLVQTLYSKMSTPDYVLSDLSTRARFNFTYAMSRFAQENDTVGQCDTFGELLETLGANEGKTNVLDYLIKGECKGYRKQAEALLLSDVAMERKHACYYLAKFGDKGSIKKMQTLSYTDSYEYKYTYPVRTACRDGYGKLQLKLDK